jgi:hypothetical protein
MYVDESGDTGTSASSPSRYYILTGLIFHEQAWSGVLDAFIAFRKDMKAKFALRMRDEIHAVDFANRGRSASHIPKHHRIAILKSQAQFLGSLANVSIINVVVDKSKAASPSDVFEKAWQKLIQRYENTIGHGNFRGPKFTSTTRKQLDNGLVFADDTNEELLRRLLRKMRRYNPIPNRGGSGFRLLPLIRLVEDASMRRSHHSYFIQGVDVAAYALRQHIAPNKHVKRHGAAKMFQSLSPALCRKAAPGDPFGIVWT